MSYQAEDNPMSQKYPEGAVIVREDAGEKRKILGCAGEVHFLSINEDFTTADSRLSYTESELERYGWKVLEEPWVPNIGEVYWYVDDSEGAFSCTFRDDPLDVSRKVNGNMYKTEEQAEAAAERVRKAYKG